MSYVSRHPCIDTFPLTLHVVISQLRQPRVFTVSRYYQWNQSRWRVPTALPGYRFAVAYAVDKITAADPTNGSLGLGLMRFVNLSD